MNEAQMDERSSDTNTPKASEEKYRTLFEVMDEGYLLAEVLKDQVTGLTDILYLEANPAAVRLAGRDFTGQRMRDIDPNYEEYWYELYDRVASSGEAVRGEYYAEPHGRWFDFCVFKVGDRPSRLVATVFQDVTERKRANQALRESEERHAFLLRLSDELRSLADAEEIQATTARMLGDHLGVDRAIYAEIEGGAGSEKGTIRGQYVRPGGQGKATVPLTEHFAFAKFGQHTMAERYRGEPLIVADVENDPAYNAHERAAWRDHGVRAAIVATLARGRRLVAEFGVHSTSARKWTHAEVTLVQDVADRSWTAAQRARTEAALRESEQKYRTLFETMGQGYQENEIIRDEYGRAVDHRVILANPRSVELTGIALETMLSQTANDLFPGMVRSWTATFERVVRSGEPERIEYEVEPLGRWYEVYVYPKGGDRFALLFDETTDRRRAEQALRESERRSKTLLAELQHRVRNILGMIRSVARRTGGTTESVEDYVRHLEGRISAMARTQALLTRDAGAAVDLHDLILDELETQAAEPQKYRLQGPDVPLPAKAAEVLGLALHELATNSVKYGALRGDTGRIDVQWSVSAAADVPRLRLNWSESGVEFDEAPRRSGFGTELITRRVPYELHGTGALEFAPTGLLASFEFPLNEIPSILQTDGVSR